MPSSKKARKTIIDLIPDGYNLIYELGSGWGNLALDIGKKCPNSKVLGYEMSVIPWLFSLTLKKLFQRKNVALSRKNFFKVDFENADVFVCYLCPSIMAKLKKKFDSELKKNAIVITNSFVIPGWKPIQVVEARDLWNSKIYVYGLVKNEMTSPPKNHPMT